ncbi:MAG TPA: hypothetical protein PK878_20370 [bacterium]|nr:hypothetical protein [bacterium]HPP02302.1 hypothetical protein [bacterium]HXK92912.1 hypothetical protein [bacterium]
MPRFYWFLLTGWCLVVLFSGAGFYYLAHRPQMMLVVEDYHPSFAYERGRELLKQSNFNDAIASFRKGMMYFKQLYEETGSASHRRHYARGLLELANAYSRKDDPVLLAQAVELYGQACQLEPDVSEGHPYLAHGEVLERLKRYEEAVDRYTVAVERGSARFSLLARFGRGQCRLALGQTAEACADWYYFVRYFDQITPVHWEFIQKMPPGACSWSAYVLGRAMMALGNASEAGRYLEIAGDQFPENRSIRAYRALAAGTTVVSDSGEISLQEFYPPGGEDFRSLGTAMVDLYRAQEGPCVVRLELSALGEGEAPPVLRIEVNQVAGEEIRVLGSQPRGYAVRLTLRQGANHVMLRSSVAGWGGNPDILLRSFILDAGNEAAP